MISCPDGLISCPDSLISCPDGLILDLVSQLRSSLLDPHGPFEVRNALRDLRPGDTHNLAIKFSPLVGGNVCLSINPLLAKYYYGSHCNLCFSPVVLRASEALLWPRLLPGGEVKGRGSEAGGLPLSGRRGVWH